MFAATAVMGILGLPGMPLEPTPAVAQATLNFAESFRNDSLPTAADWVAAYGGTDPACLSALSSASAALNLAATSTLPGCANPALDTPGNGALRLVAAKTSQRSSMIYTKPQPTADGLDITFKLALYGGTADGMSFFLKDGSDNNDIPGARGGALGYAPIPSISESGTPKALLGIGFDLYGGFSSSDVDGTGCTANTFAGNKIVARGPGDGLVGYCFIASATVDYSGGDRATATRKVRILIDPPSGLNPKVKVYFGNAGDTLGPPNLPQLEFSQPIEFVSASTFKFGFAGSTGGLVTNAEIWDLGITPANTQAVVVTATSPTVSFGTTPTVGYTTDVTVSAYTTSPACAAYNSVDTGFLSPIVLSSTTLPGTYVTHCKDAVAPGYTFSYSDGTLTINKASVMVTAASPAAITSPAAVPTITYTTNPATVAGDWTAVPTCAVYATSDTGYLTALTGTQPAGTYATQCKGGTSAKYNPTSYVPGTLVVNPPLPTYHEVGGSGTLNNRSAGSFTLSASINSGKSVIKDLTFVSKTDKIDLSLPRNPTGTVTFDGATKSSTITGTGVLKGVGNVQYTVTVKDGGNKGKGDTFRLQIPSRSYDTGVQTLKSGDVNID